MNIKYNGPIYNCSGYSQIKFLILELKKLGHTISINSMGNKDPLEFIDLQILQELEKQPLEKPYINIISGVGPQLKRDHEAAYNIGYSMFETNTVPESWIRFYNEMDEIWVPSNFCKKSFNIKELKCTVSLVPLGVDNKLFAPKKKENDFFTFLAVGKWIDRKGWDLLINAYTSEFLGNYKVKLCIKSDEQTKTKEEMIKEYLSSDRTSHMPRILINNQKTSESILPLFFQEADCFILPTRGEGFNLPALESMSCGIPTIISDFGGHLDFVSDETGWLIPIKKLVHLSERLCKINAAYKGLWFAEPEIEDIRKIMKYAYENKDEVIQKGIKARQIAESFSWEKVALIAENRLKEIWKHIQ